MAHPVNGKIILESMEEMITLRPALTPKEAEFIKPSPERSGFSYRIRYFYYLILGEKMSNAIFGDPLNGKNIYKRDDMILWIVGLFILLYLIALYCFQNQSIFPITENTISQSFKQLEYTLLWHLLIVVLIGSSNYILRIRLINDYRTMLDMIDPMEDYFYDNSQYFNAFKRGDPLEIKLLNVNNQQDPYQQTIYRAFFPLRHRTKYTYQSNKLMLSIFRILVLITYYWRFGLNFWNWSSDWYIYPLIVLLITYDSIYITRIYDAFFKVEDQAIVLLNSIQHFSLQNFKQYMQKVFKSKEVQFDIFDIKSLTLLANVRKMILDYNKIKWTFSTRMISNYMLTQLTSLLFYIVINSWIEENFSLSNLFANPLTILILIDLIICLKFLGRCVVFTSDINQVPQKLLLFLTEYQAFVEDLISYNDGKAELHSDFYKATYEYLFYAHNENIRNHLHSLLNTIKLLIVDIKINNYELPVIFNMVLTRQNLYQIYGFIIFQIMSIASSSGGNAGSSSGSGGSSAANTNSNSQQNSITSIPDQANLLNATSLIGTFFGNQNILA